MQHYFAHISNGHILLTENDVHHLLHVMRAKVGDKLIAVAENKEYLGVISNTNPLVIDIEEELATNNELAVPITLFYCLAKGDKIEFVMQKATELGASRIVLLSSKFCVTKMDNDNFKKKLPRYQMIVKEAAEQCHRQKLPEILGVYQIDKIPDELLCDINYLAYEKCEESRDIDVNHKSISLMIGSEGGFDRSEVEQLIKKGFVPISLGKRILRTETAAVTGLSILGYLLEK